MCPDSSTNLNRRCRKIKTSNEKWKRKSTIYYRFVHCNFLHKWAFDAKTIKTDRRIIQWCNAVSALYRYFFVRNSEWCRCNTLPMKQADQHVVSRVFITESVVHNHRTFVFHIRLIEYVVSVIGMVIWIYLHTFACIFYRSFLSPWLSISMSNAITLLATDARVVAFIRSPHANICKSGLIATCLVQWSCFHPFMERVRERKREMNGEQK